LEGDAEAKRAALPTLSPHQAGAPGQIGDVLPETVWAGRNVTVFAKPGLNRRKFLRGGAPGRDHLRPTMGKIAEGHYAPVAMEVVDRRIDLTKLLVSAKSDPARLVPLHHEALPGDEPLVDDRQPGASGFSAVKAVRIVWERHGQSPFRNIRPLVFGGTLYPTASALVGTFPQFGYADQSRRRRLHGRRQGRHGM
jgi:hypothetical protein